MRHKMKLWVSVAVASIATLAVFAPAGNAATVCNEAENSPRGGYVVSGGNVDPNPPAFLRGSQMKVGNDKAKGLNNAADRSPALRQCSPEGETGPTGTDGGDGGTGGDTGGDDDGWIGIT